MVTSTDPNPTLRAVQGWLAQVRYRPGWELTARLDRFDTVELEISALVDNSRGPGRVTITRTVPVWPLAAGDRDRFLQFLAHQLIQLEVHESREWLRWAAGPDTGPVLTTPVFDPHQEKT